MTREVIHHHDGDPRNNAIPNLEIRPMPSLLDRIRAALRPSQPMPYAMPAPAEGFTVLSSVARVVQIGPYRFSLVAQDWPDIKSAETAASRAAELIRCGVGYSRDASIPDMLDALADIIQSELEIDPTRPFGCSLIAEPV